MDSEVQFHGQMIVTGPYLGGVFLDSAGRAFADAGVNWLDGNHVVDMSIGASLTERERWAGTWSNVSGEIGTFEFFYDTLGDKDSDTGLLEAVWTGYDEGGNPDVTFTIDADGAFSGQNAAGCASSGQFTVVNPAFNLYEVHSTIANCGIAGDYAGFVFLADVNDALAISIDDVERTLLLGLEI